MFVIEYVYEIDGKSYHRIADRIDGEAKHPSMPRESLCRSYNKSPGIIDPWPRADST